jgi:TRAP-type uncharacterized transport system fused permease subunit
MADLTPPVALACFAAAPMAKTSGLKISLQAVKLAAAGFIIPFLAVYTPSLMLQDGGWMAAAFGYPVEVVYIVVKACAGIGLWSAAAVGFMFVRLGLMERLLAFAGGLSLLLALPFTDELGFALFVIIVGLQWWRGRTASHAEGTA